MAPSSLFLVLFLVSVSSLLFQCTVGGRRGLTALLQPQPTKLSYHKGQLLTGPISINLIWYGNFAPAQRSIVSDFVNSLSPKLTHKTSSSPSVAAWWSAMDKYYQKAYLTHLPAIRITLGRQIMDRSFSLGKRLTSDQLVRLASHGGKRRAINVVLTSEEVRVDGFCMNRCGTHGSSPKSKNGRYTYIWVGNSATQCPGQCAWPFHQPIYGPQVAPLVAPNGDVGVDGMIINLASLLVGTVTNPFGNGYFQGDKEAPLEAASACTGVYGKGAYPGYAGDLLVDSITGGSYNANGDNGRKFLLPAVVDPTTSACSTLV